MSWPDILLTIIGVVFSYALIPQIYQCWKNKRGLITIQTGVITFTGLYVCAMVYLYLGLPFSTITTFISSGFWFVLCVQTAYYGFVKNPLGSKIVLTGVGSSGKTTVLNLLRGRGCCVYGETAREVLEERKRTGRGNQSHDEVMEMETNIYARQVMNEKDFELSNKKIAFFDRGIVDMWVYSLELMKDLPSCLKNKYFGNVYDEVFVFDPLPYVLDSIRVEKDEENALRIHQDIINGYKKFGYNPIVVPRFSENKEESIRKRVEFILKTLRRKGYKI